MLAPHRSNPGSESVAIVAAVPTTHPGLTAAPATIRGRFQLAATALALALLIPAMSGWWTMHALATRAQSAVQKAIAAQRLSASFVAAAMETAHTGQGYVLTPSPKLEREFHQKGQEAHDIAQALSHDVTASADVVSVVARLNQQLADLESHLARAHRHVDLAEYAPARHELEVSAPFQAAMLRSVGQLGNAEARHLAAATDAMQYATRYQGFVFITVFAIAAIVGTLIARWLSRTVARPLTRLVAHASAIADRKGDAHTPVDSVPGEFAALANAMNEASESLVRVASAEEIANKNQRLALIGRIVSGVAHELNNPLHTILLTIGLLQEDAADPVLRRELDAMRVQAARAREIVRDLLAAARPSVGLREVVPADSIVRRAETELTRLAAMHKAHLTIELPSYSLPNIEADRDDLTRLLGILVSNAAYASGAGGSVVMRADADEEGCCIVVEDQGSGLTDEVLSRLFEPFFTTKPVGEGSGLGLTVAQGIAEGHRGAIVAENRTDGNGARFIVRIPRAVPRPAAPLKAPRAVPAQTPDAATALAHAPAPEHDGKPRALVVDDEPSVRKVLTRILMRAGWRVDEASDGAAGFEFIDAAVRAGDDYAMILSDLRMPTMSGIELHDNLAEQHPATLRHLTITSGDLASPDVAEFVRRTSCTVMEKPLDIKELLRVATVAETRQRELLPNVTP
ncbi:MAG: hybrid sensor histidine kinase/response regulator [bacterium]